MMYRKKAVLYVCLALASLAVVAVVPHIAHAATRCERCKGTGNDICEFCGGVGCAQCNWKGGRLIPGQGSFRMSCQYCGGRGIILTPAEKKKEEEERPKREAEAKKGLEAMREVSRSIRAIDDYSEMIRQDPNDAKAYNGRGFEYFKKGDYDQAFKDYARALERNPKEPVYWGNVGSVAVKKGSYDTAFIFCNKAIQLDPNAPRPYYWKGMAYIGKNDYNKAIPLFEKSLQLEPNRADVMEALEQAKAKLGVETQQAKARSAETEKAKQTFVDNRDGKRYRAIKIGTQTWMAENLNYDVKISVTDIDDILKGVNGVKVMDGSKCYQNNPANCAKYGRLYDWYTAMGGAKSSNNVPSGVQGVCPAGWHLPSDAEWTVLTNYVGGAKAAVKKLRAIEGWGYNNGTDDVGFSALPGGTGFANGSFDHIGLSGDMWSATEKGEPFAWRRYIGDSYEHVDIGYKTHLFGVRCLKD